VDFKLIWSESSIEDLAGIVRFIAVRDGPQIARQIGFGIYDRAQILTRHPRGGVRFGREAGCPVAQVDFQVLEDSLPD
jgi:plasmid stabilization system protein ParE